VPTTRGQSGTSIAMTSTPSIDTTVTVHATGGSVLFAISA
jgi:hypothetical protein